MRTQGTSIVLTDNEERLQLAGIANAVILQLERKRKPLTEGEKARLQFAHRLWENCKQLPNIK